jgi:chromosome partitioning protein
MHSSYLEQFSSYPLPKAQTVKTIAIASAKGGSGKSTLAGALAVRACQDSARVAVIDTNYDQSSLTDWWRLRQRGGLAPLPYLDGANEQPLAQRLAALAPAYDWTFIDTPPISMPDIEEAISLADFVLAPVRSAFFDLAAANVITGLCRRHEKPFGFVLNCADAKHAVVLKQTTTAIKGFRWPLLDAQIKYRQAWIQALAVGKTGAEISRDTRPEIDGLWAEVQKRIKPEASQ